MDATDRENLPNSSETEQFLALFSSAATSGAFRRLTLGKHRGDEPPERIVVTPVTVKGMPKLMFRFTIGTREETKHYSADDAAIEIRKYLGVTLRSGVLFSTEADTSIQYSRKGVAKVTTAKPSLAQKAPTPINREKQYLVAPSEPFLRLLGISNSEGTVRSDRFDKFRQINKFVEIVDALARSSGIADGKEISVVDFGSGKNYLTFALHSHLLQSNRSVTTIGVETRQDLVDHGNQSAKEAELPGLSFIKGDIANTPLPAESIDLVVALHACDTATDDALARAITSGAKAIAVAPCCQKYVRPRMKIPADLKPILKHGIMEERFAESLTNGLRAMVLEAYGYKAKVFEFIGGDHTAKNVMITGSAPSGPKAPSLEKVEAISRMRAQFGLDDFYLDRVISL